LRRPTVAEDAREAAWRKAWADHLAATRPETNTPRVYDQFEALATGFDAGVVEGIRQARAVFEEYCRDFTVGDWDAIEAKFQETDRG
jgi:hypothetical protein